MNIRSQDLLIEQASSAFREQDPYGILKPSPAWRDLPSEGRENLFERLLESRLIERALDPSGLTPTARAVLSRIRET